MPLLPAIVPAIYLGAAVLLARRLAAGEPERGPWSAASALATAGMALHGVVLWQAIFAATGAPIGVFEAASVMTWAAVATLMLVHFFRPVEELGLLVLPLAAVSVILNALWPAAAAAPSPLDAGTRVHAALSVLAYAMLTLAACQAVFLALQERRLANRRALGALRALPPLQVQEGLLFQSLGVGFFLLSLALVSGVVFVEDLLGQHLAHKTALSVAAWLVFAVLLWGRWRHGWRGRTAIRWSIGGFALLGLAYFGSKGVLELVLGRHWWPD